MRHPIKFNQVPFKLFEDPFLSDKCEIEENPHEITETFGGFQEHPLVLEVLGIPLDLLTASVQKIEGILFRP
jgi:hypothetical protein